MINQLEIKKEKRKKKKKNHAYENKTQCIMDKSIQSPKS